nr:60S ribosomal protein L27A [Cryptomonas paramecium]
MATHEKKTRKKRGHVSCGYGRVGKHRKHPGGRGKSGGQHHLKTMFNHSLSSFFGKKGIRRFHYKKKKDLTVNLKKITNFIQMNDKTHFLNLNRFKLLGSGVRISPMLFVQATSFSKRAKCKIENTGGCWVVTP